MVWPSTEAFNSSLLLETSNIINDHLLQLGHKFVASGPQILYLQQVTGQLPSFIEHVPTVLK